MFRKWNSNRLILTVVTKTFRHSQKVTKETSIRTKFKDNSKRASNLQNQDIAQSLTDHYKVFQLISHIQIARMKDRQNSNKEFNHSIPKLWYLVHLTTTMQKNNIIIFRSSNQAKVQFGTHHPLPNLKTSSMKSIAMQVHHNLLLVQRIYLKETQ